MGMVLPTLTGTNRLLKNIYYNQNLPCLSRKRFKVESALGIISQNAGMLEW